MIYIYPDYEVAERAGAAGMFQIISIREDDLDITDKVDQGKFYHTGDEVLKDIGLNPKKTDWEFEGWPVNKV